MAEMRLDNVREPEQLRRMEEHARSGTCHFCRDGFEQEHTAPIIHETDHWFVSANDFPYKGSLYHFLIISKEHIIEISELCTEAWSELQHAITWLREHLGAPGASIFVRSGNMAYTAATLDHLHFHFLVGHKKTEGAKTIVAHLAYRQEE
jgi:diadenosine tetraphosphate (Ap4A) HIT family hydrolase